VLREAYGERMETGGVFEEVAGRKDLLGKKSGKGFFVYGGGTKKGSKGGEVNPEMREIVKKHQTRTPTRLSDEDIVHRPLLAMMNEAARALDEGSVGSAWELDLALIMGTGFPPFRGGLLKYGDALGLATVRDRLSEYAQRFGSRFEPAPLIARSAEEGRGFYED
jgi:3-hydroxyacyl-CoA dehydrogenase/enoyl-CoA hydratase/3-hydroxybutyryl-CoA epimerase